MEGESDLPARPGQRTTLAGSRGRTGKDELEGKSGAAQGFALVEASRTQDGAGRAAGDGQGAGGRQSHLGPQLPTGSRQASSSRLTLVRREQKAVSEATPPHPAEAGETPPQRFQAREPAREAWGFRRDWGCPRQGLTFMPSGPLSPGGPMSPGNP